MDTGLRDLFESFDWKEAFYDPLHDTIEADTETDKDDLARMELLLDNWQEFYRLNPEAAVQLAAHYWEGQLMQDYLDPLRQNTIYSNIKIFVMNEKNFEYLKDNIKYQGFGETLHPDLENQLKKGASEFSLAFKTEVNKHNLEATLHFRKSDSSDMYFFNKYDVRAETEKKAEVVAQTFYMNKGQGVTLKEAYNLLNGRSVHKELVDKQDQPYKAWVQLDFSVKDKNGNFERKQYHENYGFDLKEALSYYPIKEMANEADKEKLLKSLEKGNAQMVTIDIAGKETKVFIEANPQYKTINLHDSKMQRLGQEQRQELMQSPQMKEEKGKQQGKEQQEGLGREGEDEKKQVKGRKVNTTAGGEDGLVTKKRTSDKKGLSI